MIMALSTPTSREASPADQVSRLLQLIDRARGNSPQAASTSYPPHNYAALSQVEIPQQNGLRLPGVSAIFPGFSSSCRNAQEASYPTPPDDLSLSPHKSAPPAYVSPYTPPEQHALLTQLGAVRRGFAFHRKCNRHSFIAYSEAQADELLSEFQSSVTEGRTLPDSKLCEVFSIALISSTFNRVQISPQSADLFYRAASERVDTWVFSEPMAAMRCCALLGLSNIFQKATVSLLYFGKRLAFERSSVCGADSILRFGSIHCARLLALVANSSVRYGPA